MGALYPNEPRMCLFWIGPFPALMVYSAKLLEPIFMTGKHLNKGLIYTFLVPWLGNSLLIRYSMFVLCMTMVVLAKLNDGGLRGSF